VRSEKQINWSRQLGKRSQEFKRAKRQKEDILEESVIEFPEVLEEKSETPRYWVIGGIITLIIGGSVYFYRFLRPTQLVKANIPQLKIEQPKILDME
jgi:hypothetical protein